jgi:hypothetical protein
MKLHVVLLVALPSIGCGAPPVRVAPASVSEDEHGPQSERGPMPAASAPVLSNCVLHAGQSQTSQQKEKGPGGELGPNRLLEASCSFNAECVARQGENNAGDGFAYLSCTDGQCSCRLEPQFPVATVVEWKFDSACTSADQAQQLLRDHCLKGADISQ